MDDVEGSRRVRLTVEQLEKQVERLTRQPEHRTLPDPFPVCPTIKVTKEELEKVTNRVFYQCNEKRAAALRAAEDKVEKERTVSTIVMKPSEVDDIVKRVYYMGMERVQAGRKQAEERLLFKPNKVLPVVPLRKFVEDMYFRGIEREKKKEEKLYEKYILPTEIVGGKISKSRAVESANRLSQRANT
uniref:Uncharacterized protein n=1 Tax=Trypanosoma congolense (strain IL3000) TaxID=1068625 RepID=G0UWE8_TRYCI|nr:conserved hypothetical protein [Trypanosoma congolense IL3000]